MGKVVWKPSTLLYPVPAVMVSCLGIDGVSNIITVAWAGTVCTDPPTVSISIRKERYSHRLISDTGEFVINLPTQKIVRALDYCGVKSGRDVDKWKEMHLTPGKAAEINVPLILECPINIECRVTQILPLGSHDMFLAEVKAINIDEDLIDGKGRLELGRAGLVGWVHGEYWSLWKPLGHFGFSIRKKPGPRTRSTAPRRKKS